MSEFSGEVTRDAARLWKRCTSGRAINEEDLTDLEFLTDDCSGGEILDWLGKDPSKAYPHFTGPWGENQNLPAYLGATWIALLWRSPSALKPTGLETSADMRKLGDKLIQWGTAFQQRGDRDWISCSDEEQTPGLALCDEPWRVEQEWESDPDPGRW